MISSREGEVDHRASSRTLGDPDADQARRGAAYTCRSAARWREGSPIEGVEQRGRLVSGDGAGFEQTQDLETLFAHLVALGRAEGNGFDHRASSLAIERGDDVSGTSRQGGGPLLRP